MVIVNLGANVNGRPFHSLADLLLALQRRVHVIRYKWQKSATEYTLVAEIVRPLDTMEGYLLAIDLQQDCIAQQDGEKGQLLGPKAEEWGEFNPDYFLTL
jgi:hypothetical protein